MTRAGLRRRALEGAGRIFAPVEEREAGRPAEDTVVVDLSLIHISEPTRPY